MLKKKTHGEEMDIGDCGGGHWEASRVEGGGCGRLRLWRVGVVGSRAVLGEVR